MSESRCQHCHHADPPSQAAESLGSLSLLDGSHSFVAAHTASYKSKNKGDDGLAETEAMVAFLNQFMTIDYNKVGISQRFTALSPWSPTIIPVLQLPQCFSL